MVIFGIFDFAAGKGDVVPGIGCEEGAGLGDANGREKAEAGEGVEGGGDGRDIVRGPEIGEVGDEGGVIGEDEAEEDESGE
jgi:hypothetical protein